LKVRQASRYLAKYLGSKISGVYLVFRFATVCYARTAEGGAGEEERRRDEGTGNRAKEVARAAGGKAAGAWVI
jgi:hypothetical protein